MHFFFNFDSFCIFSKLSYFGQPFFHIFKNEVFSPIWYLSFSTDDKKQILHHFHLVFWMVDLCKSTKNKVSVVDLVVGVGPLKLVVFKCFNSFSENTATSFRSNSCWYCVVCLPLTCSCLLNLSMLCPLTDVLSCVFHYYIYTYTY